MAEGWAVLAQNWVGGGGELDLVVSRGDRLRFVEVKLRGEGEALAEEAIPELKRVRLRSAALAWSVAHGDWPGEQAFLVVWVEGDHLRFLDDAFDG